MRFTDLFIQRPVLAAVVSALILLLGLSSLSRVTLREFPELERSVITIETLYPGASASTVQGFVTTPLQVNLAGARGVEYLESQSDPGRSTIEVHVRLGEATNAVLTEVTAKVNEARAELPQDIEDPVISTTEGADAMIYMAFFSERMSREQVTDYLMRSVQPELSTLPGVGKAAIFGHYPAMRVWLDPVRMAAAGVTATEVADALRRDNFISSAGATEGALVRAVVEAETGLASAAGFRNLVVRSQGDQRVRLEDVADVQLASESELVRSYADGRETVFVAIYTAPGANPLEVSKRVRATLPKIRAAMPADMSVNLGWDWSVAIEEGLSEVITTLFEAALIVILVIYLFLGSLRVVFIPIVAIPLSLVGVVFLILAMGFSLNLLTLLAMVIAIGLVVDDAIVVVENVHRHIEEGATPFDAALLGAREVALPVIAMTLTLAAVYAPIAFVGGLTGALFSEFALTLAGAVIVSGIVALTLSPALAARVLKPHEDQGRFASWTDARFERFTVAYRACLEVVLRHRGAVVLFTVGILASLPLLFSQARSELAPAEDTGSLYIQGDAPRHANIDYVDRFLSEVVTSWREIPEIVTSWQVMRPDFNFGGLSFAPWSERERTQEAIYRDLQARLAGIAGMQVLAFPPPPLPGADAGLPVKFVVSSTGSYEDVYRVAGELVARARRSGLFSFVKQTLAFDRPEIRVHIDRERAASLGIAMSDIGDTLALMLGEAEVNRFTVAGRSYKVIPQAGRRFRLDQDGLTHFYVRAEDDSLVPLASVVSLERRVTPNERMQYQQLNASVIEAALIPPNTLGDGLNFLETTLAQIAPPDFRSGRLGLSRRFEQESRNFPVLFGLSLTLILLVLAAQFNSFRDPLVVLVAVPLSIFGAMVPIALGAATLNIYTQIGLLTLIGLISKHGILIVEFANQRRLQGAGYREAVLDAAALRLRPILMTTFATVLGVLPLVLATGAGANARFGIGLTIAVGMLVGTLFTLFVLPALYLPSGAKGATATPAPAGDRSAGNSGAALPRSHPSG